MSAGTDLPTLFGRFSAVLREHADLEKVVASLSELCVALEADAARVPAELSPVPLIRELSRQFVEHFATEEADAYFGAIQAEDPSLSDLIANLRHEHEQMLGSTAVLAQLAAAPESWSQFAVSARLLVVQFARHERAESGLLNRLFRPRAPRAS